MASEALWSLQAKLVADHRTTDPIPKLSKAEKKEKEKKEKEAQKEKASKSTEVKKYKWATSLDNVFKFDHVNAVPRKDLEKIQWGTLKGVERSDNGAEGVFFAETPEGALVLKGSKSLAPELFSCLVNLRLGIYVPMFRVLDTNSKEGLEMLEILKIVDKTYQSTMSLFDLHYVLIKEYIPGFELGSITPEVSFQLFSESNTKVLEQIGHILAVDCLLNNGDRLPLSLWSNPGNLGNVRFMSGSHQVVSLDSQTTAITNDAKRTDYLNKVKTLLSYITSHDKSDQVSEFEKFATVIFQLSRNKLTRDALLKIRAGFCACLKRALVVLTPELLTEYENLLRSFDPPLVLMNQIEPAFISAVLAVVKPFEEKLG
eukprot:NODE_655_length_1285_cov_93.278929_g616_i0.p1 GENE.NODE_655_length_1285_cov_93.278929_g616_i0~~NODE_655_length_1285_cov_93.278929_g616_i0.p1  ORF type:complete len:390 (-),score=102.73 NODE_655_length_1285_cov_93.278929_g616_i0:116-1231(-)